MILNFEGLWYLGVFGMYIRDLHVEKCYLWRPFVSHFEPPCMPISHFTGQSRHAAPDMTTLWCLTFGRKLNLFFNLCYFKPLSY